MTELVHKLGRPLAALSAAVLLTASGCASGGGDGGAYAGRLIDSPDAAALDDWGETGGAEGASHGAAPRDGAADVAAPGGEWAIVLGTYSGPNHVAAAETMVTQLSAISPELRAGAWSASDQHGSRVVFGRYDDPGDPRAQKDLDWVKALTLAERPVFPRAMLAKVPLRQPGQVHPLDLLNARRLHPETRPLYSLEVAVWGDFESGALRPEQIRAAAVRYAQELRAKGYEAWFHFDEGRRLGSVTIGLFDHRAIDARSGIHSPEVEALLRQFPAHLVNGEPLNEPVDRHRPKAGTRVQAPRLVLVPE